MSGHVDVLAVMDQAIEREKSAGQAYVAQEAARAAVAELIEADAAFDAATSEVATYEAVTPDRSRNYRTFCYVQFREALARRKAALARVRGAA